MKKRFWLFKRASVFFLQDVETRKKASLHTTDRREAERLREVPNEAAQRPHLGLTFAKAFLTAYDPEMRERTWATVMQDFCHRGQSQSQARARRQCKIAGKPFECAPCWRASPSPTAASWPRSYAAA